MLALLSASIDALLEFFACVLLLVLLRGAQGAPYGPVDVGLGALLLWLLGTLVRGVLRSPVRSLAGWGRFYRLPEGTEGPTAGWAHFVWSGLWIILGVWSWDIGGLAFVVTGSVLLLFRAAVRLKRARS